MGFGHFVDENQDTGQKLPFRKSGLDCMSRPFVELRGWWWKVGISKITLIPKANPDS